MMPISIWFFSKRVAVLTKTEQCCRKIDEGGQSLFHAPSLTLRLGSSVDAQDGGRGIQEMGGRHKFKRGGHSVNVKQNLQNVHRWSRIG